MRGRQATAEAGHPAHRLGAVAPALIAAGALAAFMVFGLLGVGWQGRLGEIGFGQFYAAGVAWRSGQDLYDPAQYRPVADAVFAGNVRYDVQWTIYDVYFYPPTTSALVAPLSILPIDAARLALVGLNVLAAGVVAVSLVRAALRRGRRRRSRAWS